MDRTSKLEQLTTVQLFRKVEQLMQDTGQDQAPATATRRHGRFRGRGSGHTPARSPLENLRYEYAALLRTPPGSGYEEAEDRFREQLIQFLRRNNKS